MKLQEKGIRQSQLGRQSPSPLSNRKQGYITLSPHRSKLRSQISSRASQSPLAETSKVQSYCFKGALTEQVNSSQLSRVCQRPFKPIAKFPKNQIVVRFPGTRTESDLSRSRKSQKMKLSVTTPSQVREGGEGRGWKEEERLGGERKP